MTASVFDSKFFSPEFRNWLLTASLDDVYSAVSDAYKEHHGFRPRWMANDSREQLAQEFIDISDAILSEQEDYEWYNNVKNLPLTISEPEPILYDEFDIV